MTREQVLEKAIKRDARQTLGAVVFLVTAGFIGVATAVALDTPTDQGSGTSVGGTAIALGAYDETSGVGTRSWDQRPWETLPAELGSLAVGPWRVAQATAPPDGATEPEARPPQYSGVWWTIQEWLARANREFQDVVVRGLSVPSGAPSGDVIADKLKETEGEEKAAKERAATEQAAKDSAAKVAADKAAQDAAAKAAAEAKAKELAERAKVEAEEQARRDAAAKEQAASAADNASAAIEAARLKQKSDAAAAAAKAAEQKRAEDARRQLEAEQKRAAARIAAERERNAAAQAAADTAANEEKLSRREFELVPEPLDLGRERRLARERPETRTQPAAVARPEPIARPDARETVTTRRDDGRGSSVYGSVTRAGVTGVDSYRSPRASRRAVKHRHHSRRYASRPARGCRRAGRKITPPGRYVVRPGDTLWAISRRHYSSGRKYRRIYRANTRKLSSPHLIYPCQRLFVPRRRR